ENALPLSPLVRKMARENNIDLNQIRGTGAGGRITKQDLEAHLSARSSAPSQAPPAAAQAAPPPTQAPPQPPATAEVLPSAPMQQAPPPPRNQAVAAVQEQAHFRGEAPAARVEPMSVMRQKIAEHMVFSKRTSVHVTTVHK